MQRQLSLKPPASAAEREWVDGVRTGDPAAFAAIFNAYYNRLCMYAESYVHARDAAEEIVQELFVAIWARHAEWKIHASVRQYLYTSVRNRSLQYLRDFGIHDRAHEVAARSARSPGMAEPAASAEDRLYADELVRIVDHAIARLPARTREAFVLFRKHGLTHAEISATMSISVSTVEKHVGKATRVLRDAVEKLIGPTH